MSVLKKAKIMISIVFREAFYFTYTPFWAPAILHHCLKSTRTHLLHFICHQMENVKKETFSSLQYRSPPHILYLLALPVIESRMKKMYWKSLFTYTFHHHPSVLHVSHITKSNRERSGRCSYVINYVHFILLIQKFKLLTNHWCQDSRVCLEWNADGEEDSNWW